MVSGRLNMPSGSSAGQASSGECPRYDDDDEKPGKRRTMSGLRVVRQAQTIEAQTSIMDQLAMPTVWYVTSKRPVLGVLVSRMKSTMRAVLMAQTQNARRKTTKTPIFCRRGIRSFEMTGSG